MTVCPHHIMPSSSGSFLFAEVLVFGYTAQVPSFVGDRAACRCNIKYLNVICLLKLLYSKTCPPVLRGHSKIDQTKVLKTNGSLMKVKNIAECSLGAFCNPFDLH